MQTSRQRAFEIDRQTILERASTFVNNYNVSSLYANKLWET
jgi:hypothetical protein